MDPTPPPLEPFEAEDAATTARTKRVWLLHFELSEEFAWIKLAVWALVILAIWTVILLVVLHFTEGPDTDNWIGRL